MPRRPTFRQRHSAFVALCGLFSNPRACRRTGARACKLEADLRLSGICVRAEAVASAADRITISSAAALSSVLFMAILCGAESLVLPLAVASVGVPIALREAVLGFPSGASKRRAEDVLKDSTRGVNLMIMSLGHEPSLSKAILFASRDKNYFSDELKRCVWSVVMGTCASFEESLHELGSRWARFGGEFKAAMNAMVTASRESTEDGKRRALDRANNAVIMGAKRRIEEYALSLSAPSMIMFGLGILLPLMVGSFLPMLSWNMWSLESFEAGTVSTGGEGMVETVFLMNVLFPALAFLVASNAISRHPLETKGGAGKRRTRSSALIAAIVSSVAGTALCAALLEGQVRSIAILISATAPLCAVAVCEGTKRRTGDGGHGSGLEDALFLTGARMLEGENFEAALERAASDLDEHSARTARSLSFRSNIIGQEFDSAVDDSSLLIGRSNALEGLKVVREAASKDESGAGLLAMDLAAYLKDLRDLEETLKGRLKPTITMMRMTTYALGPIVMGVTYAIYLSMGGIMGGAQGGLDPNLFLLVLGAFLAESGVIVSYFVWGIEGTNEMSGLLLQAGSCVLTSELVFAATTFLASG